MKYMIVSSGEDRDEISVSFIEAQSVESALLGWIENYQDFDLKDEFDQGMANQLLEEFPVGIAPFDPNRMKVTYDFEYFYELPDLPDPVN